MTNEGLERLEALARAATPGPWRDVKSQAWVQRDKQGPHDETGSVCIAQCGDMQDADLVPFNADRWRADAAFIAAANPTTILSLIQRVKEAEAMLDLAMQNTAEIARRASEVRRETLEEAENALEKLIDEYGYANMDNKGYSGLGELRDAVETIRELGEKAEAQESAG